MLRLFDSSSSLYASSRPRYPAELYAFLAGLCSEAKCAWDCACGSGQAAINLVDFFDKVHATDASPNQIKNAFEHRQISYAVCPSERPPFTENTFDLVCVAQALHWLDFDAFWPEVKRVLKPEGVFAAWGYCWPNVNPEVDRAIQESFLDVIAPYWETQNELLWNHYRDVTFPFESVETPSFEMKMCWNLGQLFAYLHTWSATKRCIDARGEDFFREAYHRVLSVWGDPGEHKDMEMDFCCVVGRNQT